MEKDEIFETATALLAGDKGLLAMDESVNSINAIFGRMGLAGTVDNRRAYRELIVTTPGLGDHLSGAILHDETIYQTTSDGSAFVDLLQTAGILPGIKVDCGTSELAGFPGERITLGLDTLRERMADYRRVGMRFAKWRAVIGVGKETPSDGAVQANMHTLSRYAALCQEAGLLAIVEPEVVMTGTEEMERCFEVTSMVLQELFQQLVSQRVDPHGVILKSNMILPGRDSPQKVDIVEIATTTIDCLRRHVPITVPGVAFLSGGQSPELATARLNEMATHKNLPWPITFSFSRAIQEPVLEKWNGKKGNVAVAQQMLYRRIALNAIARRGEYDPAMEYD